MTDELIDKLLESLWLQDRLSHNTLQGYRRDLEKIAARLEAGGHTWLDAEAADLVSARPGYSEHQTGLAFDLIDSSGNLVEEAGASQWLLDNAYKYGFVVRYPVGKEASTGYVPESWHLRYVGKEAKEISESGLTLEEYYHFTGGNYVQ